MKFRNCVLVIAFLSAVTAGCGMLSNDDNNKSTGLIQQDQQGCVQGVVIDGISGERLALKSADGQQGVHVIVRNKVLRSSTHVNGESENADEHLKGEYYVCGIPLDTQYPIIAWKDGYQQFEGIVEIPSTIAHRSANAENGDIGLRYPTVLGDIYMYPKGTQAHDLLIRVLDDGEVVAGATVQLKPNGQNTLHGASVRNVRRVPTGEVDENGNEIYEYEESEEWTGHGILPQIRLAPLAQVTDENGIVKFSGDELVLGGVYGYKILPPNAGSEFSIVKGTHVVGYSARGQNLASEPFELNVDVADRLTAPSVVSRSDEDEDKNPLGNITLVFNQNMEISKTALKEAAASLNVADQNGKAQLKGDGTDKALKIKVEGSVVKLIPQWRVKPKLAKDPNLSIRFSGIRLRSLRTKKEVNIPGFDYQLFHEK